MATVAPPKAAPARFRPWQVSASQYLEMIKQGILTEDDRVFLWKGRLLVRMTKYRPHTIAVMRTNAALGKVIPGGYYIEQERPIAFVNRKDSMPEPDLMVVRGRLEDYPGTPTTKDVALIVEASDSTVGFDMGSKQEGYAAESVAEYGVVSIPGRWIEVFTQPSGPTSPVGYRQPTTYRAGDRVPVRLDGVEVGQVSVDEIFA